MTYYVRAPGTCGEFLQGSIDGQSFLVTCPINRYSYALSNVIQPFSKEFCALQPKSAQARKLVQELVQQKNKNQIDEKIQYFYRFIFIMYCECGKIMTI